MSKYLNEHDLREFTKFKYAGGDLTPLEHCVLNKWWMYLLPKIPKNVAPNLLTLIGLSFSMSGFLIMLCFDFTLSEQLPSWVYFYAAFTIFVY